jgi:ubiquinol-cytochrome c reductase cytochrome b subunit
MMGWQLISGIFLAMHFTPHVDLAFFSVEHIMRDVNNGWMIRYSHANGASFFFIVIYLHILRGLYYGSYAKPRADMWTTGIVLFFLMVGTAFMGYVLVFGQMSLWAATVITNLVSSIPLVGEAVVYWIWGGFSVDNATLNRFFAIHFTLPFVLAALALVHIVLLHVNGSNNPLGVDSTTTKIGFYPYFYVKDLFSLIMLIVPFMAFSFFAPNMLGHPDNYIEANALVTPPHIVPEWYFLPFYAILRSIPHKFLGVVAMLISIVGFLVLPFNDVSDFRSTLFRPVYVVLFWFMLVVGSILGFIGQVPVAIPYEVTGQFLTVYYFAFIFALIPLVGFAESSIASHKSA